MRVGFVAPLALTNAAGLSGTPHHIWKALQDAGVEVLDLSSIPPPAAAGSPSHAPPSALRRLARRARGVRRKVEATLHRPWDYDRTLAEARERSAQVQAAVDEAEDIDLLLGACISTPFFELKTDLPIVYISDTTAHLMNTSYDDYRSRSSGYHRACDEIERTVLHRCSCFAVTSACTAHSAIDHYGLPPERVRIVEFGAHVVPDYMPIDPTPPTREHLELVLVAADPKRKRLPLCIDVVKELRARGWNATLNFVGAHHPALDSEETVAWAGRLDLRDSADREKHKEILRRSHWMLLPSTAEAFGIAPCEAAHFGRPSIVTDVGGLPTVVQNGKTGVVLPVDAPPEAYADAIESISKVPGKYADMSEAALDRSHTVLSWPMWAERMKSIFQEAIAGDRHVHT